MAMEEGDVTGVHKYVNLSNSEEDSEGEHFVLPTHSPYGKSTYSSRRNDGQVRCCKVSTCVFAVGMLTLVAVICALTGYVYAIHTQLNDFQSLIEQVVTNHSRRTLSHTIAEKTPISTISILEQQVSNLTAAVKMDADRLRIFRTVPRQLHDISERMNDVDSVIQTMQSDIYQLEDERDNIRVTFNDITMKIVNNQELLVLMWNKISRLNSQLALLEESSNKTGDTVNNETESHFVTMSRMFSRLLEQVTAHRLETQKTTASIVRRITANEKLMSHVTNQLKLIDLKLNNDSIENPPIQLNTLQGGPSTTLGHVNATHRQLSSRRVLRRL